MVNRLRTGWLAGGGALVLVLALICALLAGCGERDAANSAISVAPEPSEAADTAWIDGTVLAGPVCPVESVSPSACLVVPPSCTPATRSTPSGAPVRRCTRA